MKELLNKLEFDLIIIKSDLKKIQDKIYDLQYKIYDLQYKIPDNASLVILESENTIYELSINDSLTLMSFDGINNIYIPAAMINPVF